MTRDPTIVFNCHSPSSQLTLQIADGSPIPVQIVGSISFASPSLSNVLCVPQLSMNLISVRQLTSLGYTVTISYTGCLVHNSHTIKQIETGHRSGTFITFILFILFSILHQPPCSLQ